MSAAVLSGGAPAVLPPGYLRSRGLARVLLPSVQKYSRTLSLLRSRCIHNTADSLFFEVLLQIKDLRQIQMVRKNIVQKITETQALIRREKKYTGQARHLN